MRNLFLVLMLANLAFAAWSAWFAPSSASGRSREDGLPSLTLVSELPGDLRSNAGGAPQVETAVQSADDLAAAIPPAVVSSGEPGAANAAATDAAGAAVTDAASAEPSAPDAARAEPSALNASVTQAASRCTSVGPFRELSQAATAAAALRNAGYQPLQRVVEGEVWSGYWVYIPALPTEQQANETLAKVREGVRDARIPDAYVIRNSDSGNLVSLGVFSEIGGVSRLRDEVRALGFEPEVVDRTRRATVYWIDVALTPDQTLDFDALQPPGRIIRLEQRDCETPG
jgi:hypothetical protein